MTNAPLQEDEYENEDGMRPLEWHDLNWSLRLTKPVLWPADSSAAGRHTISYELEQGRYDSRKANRQIGKVHYG